MKTFFLLFGTILVIGCDTMPRYPHGKRKVRVTFYARGEDKWGSKTASGVRAKPGVTVAAEHSVPFGTRVRIPALVPIFGDGDFVVQDRGSAVESRKASGGLLPVIDVFAGDKRTMKRLAAIMPPILEVLE